MAKTSEKLLISKLQELRSIRPEKDWVSSTKTRVLGEDPGFYFFPYFKPALVGAAFALTLFVFAFAQNSLPGDALYSVKKISERSQALFVSQQAKPQANLQLANKRLEELSRVAEKNQTGKLSQAIDEFQVSVSQVAKNLSESSDPVRNKEIVDRMVSEAQTVSAYLGADVGGDALAELKERTNVEYVAYLISDLETRTLTESQTEILNQMKELAGQGDYLAALELYLVSQQ